ncbi:hypothetical protein ESCO_005076 [Escovopsis weberi]|uniref:Uncharacterized protein n=1 Tax=Escovopsis weberi TaxID=150374 RepID=A0A0M8N633_ESCWE|nr:hypothetical protein ESCO_005076 [Escovopsis weberi]
MKQFLVALLALASMASLASWAGLISVSTGGLVAFVTGCVISRILYIAIYPFWFSPLRHLPTPEGSNFITGHALKLLLAPSPYTYIEVWARKWPDAPFIRSFAFGNAEVVIPNSLEAFKAIVGAHAYDMDKSPELKAILKSFIGEGLVFANGETHKRLRRVVGGASIVDGIDRSDFQAKH